MYRDFEENNKTHHELPENVRWTIDIIKSQRDWILSELSKEVITSKEETNEIVFIMALGLLIELKNHYSIELIENARFVNGLFNGEWATVFEYEGWYINPVAIILNNQTLPPVFIKKNNTPSFIRYRRLLACMVVENFGTEAQEHVGIDFTTKDWITQLSKEDGVIGALIMFLSARMKNKGLKGFMRELETRRPDLKDQSDFKNKSVMAVKYVIGELLRLNIEIKAFDKDIDPLQDISIAFSAPIEDELFWVEIGNFYAIADEDGTGGIKIGKLHTLKHVKKGALVLSDYLKTNETRKENGSPTKTG